LLLELQVKPRCLYHSSSGKLAFVTQTAPPSVQKNQTPNNPKPSRPSEQAELESEGALQPFTLFTS